MSAVQMSALGCWRLAFGFAGARRWDLLEIVAACKDFND
jgi:hypothetical protein